VGHGVIGICQADAWCYLIVKVIRVRIGICMFPLSHTYVVWQVICTEVDDDARCFFFVVFAAVGFIRDAIKITPLQNVHLSVY